VLVLVLVLVLVPVLVPVLVLVSHHHLQQLQRLHLLLQLYLQL
jgi:hypothetical protein